MVRSDEIDLMEMEKMTKGRERGGRVGRERKEEKLQSLFTAHHSTDNTLSGKIQKNTEHWQNLQGSPPVRPCFKTKFQS